MAQTPDQISYQAVVRDGGNNLISNQTIGVQISILQGTTTGNAVYIETHTPESNENGLVTFEIGTGTVVSGDFTTIDWTNGPYFIKTETDPTGGTSYTITGTSELLSVPYALHAKTAETVENVTVDYEDVTNTPDLSNYLTTEVDGDPTNEIQDLQLVGNILTITNNGTATDIDLSAYLDNTDTQLTDAEITALGYIKNADDADADASNEIQDLQLVGNILTITNNGTATDIDLSAYLDNTDTQLTDAEITALGYIKNADETDPSVPTATQAGEMQYWNGTAWVTVATTTNEGATLQLISGVPTWTGGTPSVTSITGKIWMDRNLGATQVATSSTDAASYGDLYQWGRGTDGHQIRTSGTTTTLSSTDTPVDGNFILAPNSPWDWRSPQNDNLWQGVAGINNPCPTGYRIPTDAELDAERLSWGTNNAAGAFASPLKLPMAGNRYNNDGSLGNVGTGGRYWSSTVSSTNSGSLSFGSGYASMPADGRAGGMSVRCIKD